MAPILLLEKYPNVCRLCLRELDYSIGTFSISETYPEFDGLSIKSFLDIMTFVIPEDKNELLPRMVCGSCLEGMKTYARYRSNINMVHLLMSSLAELKHSNYDPLVQLLSHKFDYLRERIIALQLCTVDDFSAKDLLKEFLQYSQSAVPAEQVEEQVQFEMIQEINPLEVEQTNSAAVPDELMNLSQSSHIPLLDTDRSADVPILKDVESSIGSLYKTEELNSSPLASDNSSSQTVERSHVEAKLSCRYCKKAFSTEVILRNHIRNVHPANKKSIPCEVCGMCFRKQSQLTDHMTKHNNNVAMNYACNVCDRKFKNSRNLQKHIRTVHDRVQALCNYCSTSYTSRYYLKLHIESAHGIQMRFFCDVCVRCFDNQVQLDSHKAQHESPEVLQCGTCLDVFRSNDQLHNHPCITYRDNYFCCGHDLRNHKVYNTHQLTVHGSRTNVRVKPIPWDPTAQLTIYQKKQTVICPKCGEMFGTKTRMNNHMNICTGSEGDGPS